jgi:flagellar biosynthesis protein FliR
VLPNLIFNETEILAFALVFLRISAFTFVWPIFSIYNVPGYLKILFSLVVAVVIFPVVHRAGLGAEKLAPDIAWLAGKEVLTGLCLGFMTRLFFFAISSGANLIASSAGLANGQIFNPALGATSTTVEQFYTTLATLLFLSLNGHHIFLTGLVESFSALPLTMDGTEVASPYNQMLGHFADSGLILQSVVEAGIKISAPVLVAMFILNVVMGILSRAIPQVNVLMTSMPVNFMAAVMVMFIGIPALIFELDHEMIAFAEQFFRFMKAN